MCNQHNMSYGTLLAGALGRPLSNTVGPSWSRSYGSWIRVRIPLSRGVLYTTLYDKVCKWLAAGRWFSPGNSVCSTNKTDCHDITEIWVNAALNTITKPIWANHIHHNIVNHLSLMTTLKQIPNHHTNVNTWVQPQFLERFVLLNLQFSL